MTNAWGWGWGSRRLSRRAMIAGVSCAGLTALLAACEGGGRDSSSPTAATSPATSGAGSGGAARRIAAAATTTQIQDFVRNVGGDRVDVIGLLKPNVDPHDYEPSVGDSNAMARSDIVFVHGLGLDAWIDKTIKNANAKAPVVTTTDGINPLKGDESEPDGDPHVWFDPTLVKTMVSNIANGLARIDPANGDSYQQNANVYAAQLDELDRQVQAIYDQIPREQRKLVTNHDAFQYLARHYELTIVGAVIPSISDTAEPSAKEINDLITVIKQENVRAIFAESSANPDVARQVAQETGIKIIDTLYADTLGEPGGQADTYMKMMVNDANAIANGLKG